MDKADKIIWRYMNPYIFITQLIRKEFLFVRITRMEDRSESLLKEKFFYEYIVSGGRNKKSFEKERTARLDNIKEKAAAHYISSWTYCEYENLNLWQNFSTKFGGIAIKSRPDIFKNAIANSGREIFGKPIKYYPPQNKNFSLNPFSIEDRVFSKYEDFFYEQEYRFAIYRPDSKLCENIENDFLTITVDLEDIIENIIISPLMKKTDYKYLVDTIKVINMSIAERIQPSAFKCL